jgi:hypothetical protein
MPRLLAACLLLPLLAWGASAQVAAPREIDRAVAAYEKGERAAAQAAFERLAKAGLPAADYNLAPRGPHTWTNRR